MHVAVSLLFALLVSVSRNVHVREIHGHNDSFIYFKFNLLIACDNTVDTVAISSLNSLSKQNINALSLLPDCSSLVPPLLLLSKEFYKYGNASSCIL